jgi:PST family polysaccharide transporter
LWTTGANVGSRLVTIVSTFVLTHYLAPEVQGEVNVAVAIVAVLTFATTFGVGQFVAAHPHESRAVVFHGTLLSLAGGLLSMGAAIALGSPLSALLHTPDAARYVPTLAVAFFIERMSWMPRQILARDMRFRLVGMRIAVGELVFASVSVGLAYADYGGDAIVYANVVRSIVAIVFLTSVTKVRDYLQISPLSVATFRRILAFGLPINHAGLLSVAATLGDNMLMARLFGAETVGLYNQAYRIAELPGTTVGDQVNDVLVPTFARLNDREARNRGLLRAIGLMGLVVFPMAVGLGAVAETAVQVFYSPAYRGVAPFLAVLATMSILRSLGTLAVGYLQVVGRTLQFIWIELVLVLTILTTIALLSPLGPVVSACGVGVGFSLHTIILMSRLRPEGIRLVDCVKAALGPLLACLPMAAAVLGFRELIRPLGLPPVLVLVVEIAIGGVAFVASAFVFASKSARDFVDLAKGIVKRRRGKGEQAPAESQSGT